MRATGNGSGGPVTPVLVKTSENLPWPEDERIFYILGRNGLYLCRNHEFFQSCVPARRGPSELEEQATFLAPRFPMIPRVLFERAVGFFDQVAELHSAEAAVLLVWDRSAKRVRLAVPEQTAPVSPGWNGTRYPIGVHYVPPADLPADWVPFGDIHSHVNYSAYASSTDVADEVHTAGLHIVVGGILREPPDIHVEAVVDGNRFALDASQVIEDYRRRRMNVPEEWIERVQIKESGWGYRSWSAS